MERTLLDIDIFSEVLKQKNPQVTVKAKQYYQQVGRYTISTITVLEIVKGFHKINRENDIQRLLTKLLTAELLTLTIKSAELAGRIYADLERTGQPIGRADPMIAAIAIERKLVLATGNEHHYQRIQELGYDLAITNWKR
ncbi:MAG: PIN domain-containing protein [Candidatus Aminicenantes bacterium]|jgi:tRNA(fMet)-specific endonuclease VapC